ncbi:MAG: carboxypeptidase-like regulatory domain-containing protein, partial [Planctomycetes bacterium]|nr:carboxypeptidase-like regulatory domain-containing protein [Planctomycetota bacterium]
MGNLPFGGFLSAIPSPNPASPPSGSMKSRNPFALVASLLALAIAPAPSGRAADTASTHNATLTGRVQNFVTGQYLNNARVAVRGTSLVAFTDETGVFLLPQVPAGRVVVEVFYTGLDSQTTTVELAAGQTTTKDFDLTNAARYGDTAVVK